MQSKNFNIEILNINHVQLRVDYYLSNKEHLEIWHPTTPKGFYTFKYQKNKIKCIKELRLRIEKNNYIPPKRIRTKPTRGSIERRLLTKKYKSEKKKNRKKPNFND